MTEKRLQLMIELVNDAIERDATSRGEVRMISAVMQDEELQAVKNELETELRHQQLISFKDHVLNSMPSAEDNDDLQQAFYDLKFTIDFNGRSITVDNCATIYNAISDGLQELIDE